MPRPEPGPSRPPVKVPLSLRLAILLAAAAFLPGGAANELETLKANTDRWIELRSQHAKEANQWRLDKTVLNDSIATLQATKENLQQDLQFFASEQDTLSDATATAEAKLARLEALDATLIDLVSRHETRLQALARSLPPPLVERLRALLARIPSSAANSEISLPNRLQNLVAIMTAIDEFNNTLTFTRAIRDLDDGDAIEVRILYFGLATGYAVDATGSKAWTLSPGDDTWTWQDADADAPAIHALFQVYEKSIDPMVVEAPFPLSQTEDAQ